MLSAATSLFLPQKAHDQDDCTWRLSTIAKALNTGRNKSDKQKSYHAFIKVSVVRFRCVDLAPTKVSFEVLSCFLTHDVFLDGEVHRPTPPSL